MNIKKTGVGLLSIVFSLGMISFSSYANDNTRFGYLGFSHKINNSSDINFAVDQTFLNDSTTDLSVSKSGTSNRIFAGYHFNQYIALEVGYDDGTHGDFSYKQNGVTTLTGNVNSSAWDVRIVLTKPITGNLFAKATLGRHFWDLNQAQLHLDNGVLAKSNVMLDGEDKVIGLGLGFALNRNNAFVFDIEQRNMADEKIQSFAFSYISKF